ncbi:MAG TPA: carboxypeptidase regulatory-like domain-containing protein, partial [Bacteroidota bacterium]|nr:carboxypeptidase regulatory-like domain-containing protein [Bacteroidota bacterium]
MTLLTALVGSVQAANVTVSGTAKLFAHTDCREISAVFTATSPTAVTDSTLTDSTGHYSLSLPAGTYKVTFWKTGYYQYLYSNSILFNNSSTLSTITLESLHRLLSGTIDGLLSADTVYEITSNVDVPLGDTLVISPGTIIRLDTLVTVEVDGVLIAKGLPVDSILFTSTKTRRGSGLPAPTANDWQEFKLVGTGTGTDTVEYCHIEYSRYGLNFLYGANHRVINCLFYQSGQGVYCNGSVDTIVGNTF